MKNFIILTLLLLHSYPLWAKCQGFEDPQRIKHVQLESPQALYYCMGYLHGFDRAWQMLYFRQVAHGEISEVLGFDFVKQDFQMRLLNFYDLAQKIKNQMDEEQLKNFNQYIDGVNAGFRKHLEKPSPEFESVPVNQKPWRIVDSLMLMLLQSFDQTRKTFISDIEEEILRSKFKGKADALSNPDFLPWDTTIIKDGEHQKKIKNKSTVYKEQRGIEKLKEIWQPIFGEEAGSNNWVIEKSKTKSNYAILANDPHLDLKTPMFWYWANFTSSDLDVIGASFPGVPVIVSGTNRHVSWGLTNSYIKTAKAFAISEDEEKNLISFRPVVWFKFGFLKIPIFFKTFYRTQKGNPIIPLDLVSRKMALSWSGFHLKASDIKGLDLVMRVKNVNQMDEALKEVGVPSWNFVFADIHGDIGYRVVGRAFKMTEPPPYGLDPMNIFDFLTADEMPHLLKPKRNYIVTANNRHWPFDHEYHGGRGYTQGFRALRIETLLTQQKNKIEVNDVHQIQIDDQSVDAFFFRDRMAEIFKNEPALKIWSDKLLKWNLRAGLNCEACFFYRRVIDLVLEKFQTQEGVLYRLLEEKNKEVESTFKEVALNIVKEDIPKWGDVHEINFPHLSLKKELKFSPTLPSVGDKHSVNPGSMKWEDGKYQHTAGASQRLIVEMKENPEVYLTLPGLNARYWQKAKFNPWSEWTEGVLQRVLYPVDWSVQKVESF